MIKFQENLQKILIYKKSSITFHGSKFIQCLGIHITNYCKTFINIIKLSGIKEKQFM